MSEDSIELQRNNSNWIHDAFMDPIVTGSQARRMIAAGNDVNRHRRGCISRVKLLSYATIR